MAYFDISPLASKINWTATLGAIINGIAILVAQPWVSSNPSAVLLLNFAAYVLIGVLRTFFSNGPTTLNITKAVLILALAFGFSSTADARPVRVCDGTACRVVEQPTLAGKQRRCFGFGSAGSISGVSRASGPVGFGVAWG